MSVDGRNVPPDRAKTPYCPASENHSNARTALKMFTIALQPKSVASHLRFIQFSKGARCLFADSNFRPGDTAMLIVERRIR